MAADALRLFVDYGGDEGTAKVRDPLSQRRCEARQRGFCMRTGQTATAQEASNEAEGAAWNLFLAAQCAAWHF